MVCDMLFKVMILCCIITLDFCSTNEVKYRKLSRKITFNILEYSNMTLGHSESPVWDADADTLYWVDVVNQDVHALDFRMSKHSVKHISYGEVNAVVPVQNSSRVLVCVRSEIFLLDWTKHGDSALRLVAAVDVGKPDNVVNEGKADALGRFWGGTKGKQHGNKVAPDEAALYMMERPRFTPQTKLKPVTISNGLIWSHNNTVMYYIDSPNMKIEAFDFDLGKAHLSNRRTILDIRKHGYTKAVPDGMTIDEDGFLWVALMFEGTIICIDPDLRRIAEKISLPVSYTTSLTWAGRNLDQLVVTTSRRNMRARLLDDEPYAGSLIILKNIGTRGVPSHKVIFDNADHY